MTEEYYKCPFGIKGIKIPHYSELSSPPKSDKIHITVCASTWNRPKEVITRSIKTIFGQEFPKENYEVILVDDATEGARANDVKAAVDQLIRGYPNHNFRAYFTNHTRCWTDPHILNVAFKRALGWIIMISQVDIIHIGETLEAAWRHHNARKNLWLCPKHYCGNNKPWPFAYFPHEMGSSIRKEYVEKIKGRNELIKGAPCDVEFHWWLQKVGVVFGEDSEVKTMHVAHHPPPRDGQPPDKNPGMYSRHPNGTWTSEDWGVLTPEEEANIMMTDARHEGEIKMTKNPCDAKETADRVLDEFVKITESLNIRYFLAFGTCLGFVRDHGYTEGDNDIDVGVICSEEAFQRLTETLREHGFNPEYVDGFGRPMPMNRHFYKDNILLDIWHRFRESEKRYQQTFQKITYNGKEYNIPHPVEGYLESYYGNWRVKKRKL